MIERDKFSSQMKIEVNSYSNSGCLHNRS